MRKYISILLITAIIISVMMTGCGPPPTDEEVADVLAEKAEAFQPLLSVFTAAQNLYVPPETTSQSLSLRTLNGTSTDNNGAEWYGKTPFEVYGTSTGVVSVGSADNLLQDLNGSTGDHYYFTLSQYGTNPDGAAPGDGNLYKVTLYTYPSTSASVYYILEEYLVNDHVDWPMVNSSGETDGLAFIRYETYYYDGGVDYRTLIAAYYDYQDTHYALDDLFDPVADDDPKTSTSFNYPSDPTSVIQTTDNPDNEFSVLVSGTIPANGMNFYEYYSEGAGYLDRRAASYLYTDLGSLYIDGTEETVRRYLYDVANNTKTVRSKTVTTMNLGGTEVVKTTYEWVDMDLNNATYDSTVEQVKVSGDTTTTTTTVIDLNEGDTQDSYTGTVSITIADGTPTIYNADLTSETGLVITDSSGNDITESGYSPVALEEGQRLITMEIPEEGTLQGFLTQGILNGLIRSGRVADVIVGPTYIQVIYDRNRRTR